MYEETITDELYREYMALRKELRDVAYKFNSDEYSYCHDSLGVQLYRPLGVELYRPFNGASYSESDWADVIVYAKEKLPEGAEWDDWKIIDGGHVCSRVFGCGDKSARLKEFLGVVTQARDVLYRYADLHQDIPESYQWTTPAILIGFGSPYFFWDDEPLAFLDVVCRTQLASDYEPDIDEYPTISTIVVGKNTLSVVRYDDICVASAEVMEKWLPAMQPTVVPVTPVWDEKTYMLRFQNKDIKKIDRRAGNQVKVMRQFQQQGWPHRITDPLTKDAKYADPKRLQDVVYQLNLKHITPNVVVFKMDGTGGGLSWERHS